MSFRINRSCRGNLGFFLTSDTDDKCPKEHVVLKNACDVARVALKENKIRARNFLANLVAFDEQVISGVKKAIQDTANDASIEMGPNDNREFLDSLTTEGGAFSYAYAVVFACMKRYSDDMIMKLQEEAPQETREQGRQEHRRDEPKRRRARNGNVEER
jgi:hypothetical protein